MITVELSDHPHFSELLPLFQQMHPAELQKSADWMLTFASDCYLDEECERRRIDAELAPTAPLNDSERHPGVVTYRQ